MWIKRNNSDHRNLTFWGASPIIFITTISYTIVIIIVNHLFRANFEINFIPYKVLIALAIFLLSTGVPLYIATLKALKVAYKRQELITNGIFSICRNPLFAEVIFLILPGTILFFNSWLLLTIPCFMYIMFQIFIHREEYLMETEFGQEYIRYKSNTSAIFPQISLTFEMQVILSVPCISVCMLGMIWFNRSLNLIKVNLLDEKRKLITDGPFNYVRHPLYTTLLLTIPPLLVIWFSDLLFFIPWVVILTLSHYVVSLEERGLIKIFGEDYEKFRRFVPPLLPYKGNGGKLYREHQDEYTPGISGRCKEEIWKK